MRARGVNLVRCKRTLSSFPSSSSFLDARHGLSDSAIALYEASTKFAEAEVAPHAAKWDADSIFPESTLRSAASLGFASMWASEEFGGSGLTRCESLVVLEAFARACPSFAAYLSIHGMVAKVIDTHGSAAQRAQYGHPLASASAFASYCLTEPGAGSDAASLKTKATREKGSSTSWRLDGQKAFISGGGRSDVYLVMARSGGPGASGLSAFLVDGKARGLSFGVNEKKMGWKCQPTAAVYFDGVAADMVGEEGAGFKIAMQALDGGRLSIAACSVGAASAALDAARAHVITREQFAKALASNQAVSFAIADMATDVFTARATLREAGKALDTGHPSARALCALAKALATERSLRVVDQALQLHGGYGYLSVTGIEKLLRDVRVPQKLCVWYYHDRY